MRPCSTGNPMRSDLKDKMLCRVRGLLSIASGIFLFLAAAGSLTAEQKGLEVLAASQPIPLEEVAARSAEVADLLRTLRAQFTPGPEIEEIQKGLAGSSGHIAEELRRTSKILLAQPTLEMLQTQQQLWQRSVELMEMNLLATWNDPTLPI